MTDGVSADGMDHHSGKAGGLPLQLRPGSAPVSAPVFFLTVFLTVFLASLLSLSAGRIAAQETGRIVGTVTDSLTGEPLSRTNIRVLDTTLGTITNAEGSYRLLLPPGDWRIVFSFLGYRSDTLRVALGPETIERNITLAPVPLLMPSVVVRPGSTGDPAEELIRRALAAKAAMLADLRTLQYEAYTRTTLTSGSESAAPADLEILGILESQTRGYWATPDQHLETIIARRQTATFAPAWNIITSGRMPNFYQDRVIVADTSVPSPMAADAFDHYTYSIIDTLQQEGERVFIVAVDPKRETVPLFTGTLMIADGSWHLLEVDLEGNQANNRPPLTNWRLRQQYSRYEDRWWLPIDSWVLFQIEMEGIDRQMLMEMHAVLYDYTINEELPRGLFGRYEVQVDPGADAAGPEKWEGWQILPLTTAEVDAYVRIEREVAELTGVRKVLINMLLGRSGAGSGTSRIVTTSFSDFFHFNRVEGMYLGAGLTLSDRLPLTDITLRGGYGFADRTWKYSLEFERILSEAPELVGGFGLDRSLVWREGLDFYTPSRITSLGLFYHIDPVAYYLQQGWSFWLRFRPIGIVNLAYLYQDREHSSVTRNTDFSIFNSSRTYRENAPIIGGRMRSGTFSAEIDTRKFIQAGRMDILIEGENSIRIRGDLEISDASAWKSDFSFLRMMVMADIHLNTVGSGYLETILRGGISSGELPPQLMFDLYGGAGGAYQRGAFMSLEAGEFAGDTMGLIWMEHNFRSWPLRLLGLRPRGQFDVDLLLHGAVGWCSIKDFNSGLRGYGANATRDTHWEVGVGVSRLMTFLRLDYTWRMTHGLLPGGKDAILSISATF